MGFKIRNVLGGQEVSAGSSKDYDFFMLTQEIFTHNLYQVHSLTSQCLHYSVQWVVTYHHQNEQKKLFYNGP